MSKQTTTSHKDHQSVNRLTHSCSGRWNKHRTKYQYDPFGNTISKSGLLADQNKYRFSSKEWNESAGLYYYGFRFYDPNLQRWLNRDPILEVGAINLFAFAANAPLDFVDDYGLQECLIDPRIAVPEEALQLPPPRPQIPPSGLIPNPFRQGSWGRIGPNGKFKEVWRIERGQPGKPGWGGIDHLHFNGEKPHFPIDTPFSFDPNGNIVPNSIMNAPPSVVVHPPASGSSGTSEQQATPSSPRILPVPRNRDDLLRQCT